MGVVERALGSGGTAKVIADLQKAVKAAPNDTRSLLRLAELEAKGGNAAVACELYSRAGDIFVLQGFARRALSAFTQALNVARDGALVARVAPIARNMAKLYISEKLVRDAVSTIDTAARWLIERGFDSDALPLLESRIEHEDSEVARVRLAETLYRLGQTARASGELVTVFLRLHAQRRRDEALDVAERLLGERRDVAISRMTAELYLKRNWHGDAFHAIAKLRICCEEEPNHVPTLELLARAFDLAGHADKATRVRTEIGILVQGPKAARVEAVRAQPAAAAPAPAPAKVREASVAITVEIDEAWDELLEEAESKPAEEEKRIDPSRASFWAVGEGPTTTEGSVVSVDLEDVEIVDADSPAESGERPVSLLETALECIESLTAQGRYEEALVMVGRYLTNRPNNPLLLERKAEIEEIQSSHLAGPPPALYGFTPKKADSERSIPTRLVRAS